jgi:hypothetical protein
MNARTAVGIGFIVASLVCIAWGALRKPYAHQELQVKAKAHKVLRIVVPKRKEK